MKRCPRIIVVVAFLSLLSTACNKHPEKEAKAEPTDFTGFWKGQCSDAFGVQIKKQAGNLFSVSFCGPGGCFEPGAWAPNTPIVGDAKYRVINSTTLDLGRGAGWERYFKCTTDTNPPLNYATMPHDSSSATQQATAPVTQADLGLPDYVDKSPFKTNENATITLKRLVNVATVSQKPCKAAEVDAADLGKTPLFTNICDKSQSEAIRKLLPKLAPDLTFGTTTVWKTAIDSDAEGSLLVTHIDLSTAEESHDPYLSLWRLKFKSGRLNAQFGGSFLAGEIYAISPFGHEDKARKVFVKHLSCTACEPWVYLTIVDFSHGPAKSVKFTYAEDHKAFDDTIEYELPGMGHSIDAKVETRIPESKAAQGTDLIQKFAYTEEKKTEWWVFSCKGGQCDYRMFDGPLPEKYRSSWDGARKL